LLLKFGFEYRAMNVISFALYYIRLRTSIAFGFHYTAEPLGIRWRWHQWNHIRKVRRRHHKPHLGSV
jgi:hypothetical protein